jgi:hypothetical protein
MSQSSSLLIVSKWRCPNGVVDLIEILNGGIVWVVRILDDTGSVVRVGLVVAVVAVVDVLRLPVRGRRRRAASSSNSHEM